MPLGKQVLYQLSYRRFKTLVEDDGIEPTTFCLQSSLSPN
jgi:hypothetical protein